MSQPLRLLIVEDSEDDADQLLRVLRPAGYEPAYEIVDTLPAMRTALEHKDWDLITSDHSMPKFSAPAALALAKELRPNAPFIVVTGQNDLSLAVSLMKSGARDYIRKEELERLVPTIEEVMREVEVGRERQRTEHLLQVSEARYRRLFETAQDGILTLDADTGQITDVNPYLVKMLGYPQEDFIGKKLWEIGTFKDTEASKSTFLELQTQGYIRYEDLPLEASDERRVDVEFVSNVYMVGDKKVIQCNIRNITRRKEAEAKVRHLNAELEQRLQDRTVQLEVLDKEAENFNYSISHDLRAPLRWIGGFAQALEEDYARKLDPEGQRFIEKIRASAERMGAMLDGLIEVARFSRTELRREPVDLTAMVRRVAADLQQSAPDRKVEFVIAAGITANGDPRLLQRVLENLLNNAYKFTAKRVPARIEFGAAPQTDGRVAYFVRDNGVGFDMAYADRLFGAFQRLHGAKEFPGAGIGLATVERIVHRHGGQVWAEGAENTSATFYFTLLGTL
ncbi:MAG TPA: ATP-binding protein [Terriglobales bacterium]|nr:ATP-binding protein [Terriglobales bacterium]